MLVLLLMLTLVPLNYNSPGGKLQIPNTQCLGVAEEMQSMPLLHQWYPNDKERGMGERDVLLYTLGEFSGQLKLLRLTVFTASGHGVQQ